MAAKATILLLGDSLSTAVGVTADSAWPAMLQRRLSEYGYLYTVINDSQNGRTSAELVRMTSIVVERHEPAITVIAVGGMDGLQNTSPALIQSNLQTAVLSASRFSKVLLIGMRVPEFHGATYAREFHHLYHEVATRTAVTFVDFLLARVPSSMMQLDGIHPAASAQAIVLENVWSGLRPLLDSSK